MKARHVLPALLLLSCLSSLSACGADEPFPLFADLQWLARCDIDGGCVLPPARTLSGFDGEAGLSIDCEAVTSGSDTVLNFRATMGIDYGMEFRNVAIPRAGGSIGAGSCEVVVTEDQNSYRGRCGPDAPTGGCLEDPDTTTNACVQPCRIYDIGIAAGEPSSVTGKIYCQGLPLEADRTRAIEITDASIASSGRNAQDFPVVFRIDACPGL